MSDRLILVTNDDGIFAPGLDALAKSASGFGKVVVVAPDTNRSAISSAMSVHGILRLEEAGPGRFSCSGTPVDCVLMGLRQVLDREPDWLLAGINWGYNLAEDVLYSGTVGAAMEGCLQGIRSAAFSLSRDGDLEMAPKWIESFLSNWEKIELPPSTIWNVNLPVGEPKGFRITSQGQRKYYDLMEQRHDPRGNPYFWIGGDRGPDYTLDAGTDTEAVHDGFVSLTPIQMNLSCWETISKRQEIEGVFSHS
jgi:5'-nucleotidase